ncbi:hypothetical protein HWV62_6873 [Athelia sp. TMB]|nr:hypothetical protein HWV62_6873 [Athelia sp. TMB]
MCDGVAAYLEIGHVLTALGARAIEGIPVNISLRWPKLHTIAVRSALDVPGPQLDSQVSALQEAGIPIRKLMLPPALIARASGEMMTKLRTLVEVEDFSLDRPDPFKGVFEV